MALSRIGSSAELATLFARSSYAASTPRHSRPSSEKLHATGARRYPEAPTIPVPSNISEIMNIETGRFAPERARDIAAPLFYYNGSNDKFVSTSHAFNQAKMHQLDSRVDSYDCFGAVSLNSSMQTNVPKPFCSSGKSTYLNMPGGQWARDGKYLSEILNKSHFTVTQMRNMKRAGILDDFLYTMSENKLRPNVTTRCYSTAATGAATEKPDQKTGNLKQEEWMRLSKRERLKIIINDYGKTVLVFHITISLISLGCFYFAVDNGLDITPAIQMFTGKSGEPPGENELVNKIMGQGSTFLIAYAMHKLFAPVRLSATLGLTPLIVRFLRKKGILKPPKIAPAGNTPR